MSSNFTFHTTAAEVADAFASELSGKNVLVTGTSLGGLGFETARVLAKYANLVIITGYNAERLALSEETIKKEFPYANIRKLTLDLSSLAAVRAAAAQVNTYPEPLHVLINNAVADIGPFKVTPDNLEFQIATGFIGPFLFTNLLIPKLLAARTETYAPRIVCLSSIAHGFGPGVDPAALGAPISERYPTIFGPYYETKSAMILFASELSKRAEGKLLAFSVNPGCPYDFFFIAEFVESELLAVIYTNLLDDAAAGSDHHGSPAGSPTTTRTRTRESTRPAPRVRVTRHFTRG
ncbi:short chain dehydrogenase reductase [Roridomyces roridus]|uniref:Short chain dehydrogenase reductase n=1 Tax=Roridomyces roridus TaxID=1738132 RepID=A0AAD7FXG4_9AGAR|nr:short chain dehydrogenase reductase [Roridomyces roridus]